MSLVKGQLPPQLYVLGRFVGGFMLSATALFLALFALGNSVASMLPATPRAYIMALICVVIIAIDLRDVARGASHSVLSLRRQTPRSIANRLGLQRAALAWGLDTGLGFTTYRVSPTFWLVATFTVMGFAPWWTGIAYGLGFLTPLAIGWGVALLIPRDSPTVHVASIASTHVRGARLVGFALLCATGALSIGSLASV